MLIGCFTDRVYEPVELLQRAYELRTGNLFYNAIIKDGRHGYTTHRGMLLHILRYDYGYPYQALRAITGYRCNQPVIRTMDIFLTQLTINYTLRRDYESIRAMLSI